MSQLQSSKNSTKIVNCLRFFWVNDPQYNIATLDQPPKTQGDLEVTASRSIEMKVLVKIALSVRSEKSSLLVQIPTRSLPVRIYDVYPSIVSVIEPMSALNNIQVTADAPLGSSNCRTLLHQCQTQCQKQRHQRKRCQQIHLNGQRI